MKFKHLEDTGLGYVEHARGAMSLAGACLKAAGICVVHAVYPDWGDASGSAVLREALRRLDEAKEKDE